MTSTPLQTRLIFALLYSGHHVRAPVLVHGIGHEIASQWLTTHQDDRGALITWRPKFGFKERRMLVQLNGDHERKRLKWTKSSRSFLSSLLMHIANRGVALILLAPLMALLAAFQIGGFSLFAFYKLIVLVKAGDIRAGIARPFFNVCLAGTCSGG